MQQHQLALEALDLHARRRVVLLALLSFPSYFTLDNFPASAFRIRRPTNTRTSPNAQVFRIRIRVLRGTRAREDAREVLARGVERGAHAEGAQVPCDGREGVGFVTV
ncbi:hypothetical protein B0H16DRAFT_1742805 [Mycena metata]|uniref:Uncharacterized protein n=1 Tax=Mycena metata TaxID=1033252 RepID=A0AAD7H8H1_9AGAR|nr:hypothetical protein B0H16DRAFT_1742805 [Mycena metata]